MSHFLWQGKTFWAGLPQLVWQGSGLGQGLPQLDINEILYFIADLFLTNFQASLNMNFLTVRRFILLSFFFVSIAGMGQTLNWKSGTNLSIRFSTPHKFDLLFKDIKVLQNMFPAIVSGKDTTRLTSGQWKETSLNEKYATPFYRKSEASNSCRIFVKEVSKDWRFELRLFADGMAYRWLYKGKVNRKITNEICQIPLQDSTPMIFGYGNGSILADPFFQSFESVYSKEKAFAVDSSKLIFNPLLIQPQSGGFLVLTESNLSRYPGLHWKMKKGNDKSLNSTFAKIPLKSIREGRYALRPVERADYIAEITPGQALPWRIFGFFENEGNILTSDLVYNLSEPQKVNDISWITAGKATWDWWNDWSISGVNFKAGSNTATYKYYIDFASESGLAYFNIDDGWSDMDDLYKINPDVNLDEVIAYAKQKNVKIILWATWFGIKKDVSGILKHYASKGVSGFKIDFLDRDDQEVITWMEEVLEEGLKYKLLINFHGACKPTGWARTYPNEVNREGVYGAENFKWSNKITAEQECLLPFIRGFAGFLDYTPGGLRNINEKNFKPVNSMPFVKGTRCHQLALYGIYEAPLQMVSDLPQAFRKEPEALDFIAKVPTVWTETRVLVAELGKVIAMARKSKAGKWYVFVLGAAAERKVSVNLSFTGGKRIIGMADGPNADKNATDWKAVQLPIQAEIMLAPGGGFVGEVE